MGRIVIAGGSGFLGHALVEQFNTMGHEVVVLSRGGSPVPGARVEKWDGESLGDWCQELEGAEAVINLSGESVGQHWSKESKARILTSRVLSTKAIGEAIHACKEKPRCWINSSATGYYGDRGSEELNESSGPGKRGHFLVDTCVAWEQMVLDAEVGSTRKVLMRTGMVLGKGGGVFAPLFTLTKFFLGGHHGSGEQFWSWIHLEDLARLFAFCVQNPIEGPVNGVAPDPVTNRFFMASLRGVMNRPWSPPVPAFLLQLVSMLGGPEASLLTEGQRVMPKVAVERGFEFRHPRLLDALKSLR